VTFLSYVTGSVHTLFQEQITRFKNDNSSYRKSGNIVTNNPQGMQYVFSYWYYENADLSIIIQIKSDLLELFYLAFYIARYRWIL
jgi:hypothetical protein